MAVRERGHLHQSWFASTLAVLLILLGGCDGTASPPSAPPDMETVFWESVPVGQPDGTLSLAVADGVAALDPGAPISLVLENTSQSEVRFQPGYGARMYAYVSAEERWVEIRNRADYIGSGDTLGPSSGPSGNWIALVTVAPDLEGIERPVTLRVLVEGDVLSGGSATGKRASAYADVLIGG